ncbi:methyltransferase MtaB domain-containing protein [Clostridium formicaceticum]|uniref:Methanol--corrinoid methyltransferase n=1 Tax=Clostridium formicaceticum TaxID=1497 RepID=A0AAC9RPL3_9CLOT|nr:methyltransferase MtaB domain-containing protein [Clostridium formicaceticum]AOY74949.1 methanol--corrinoid methyltransferase [Clostridium formicaceticum]ARE89357.1 Methanol-cobalamin methyltransferase B subunit [Clostridium formicaceticum]
MLKKSFKDVCYKDLNSFVYGKSLYPVKTKNGLEIGGGVVLPELNFTLPTMEVSQETMPKVLTQYTEIMEDACKRAHELKALGYIAEIEMLPPATYNPKWGVEIVKVVREVIDKYESNYGLKGSIRLTPVDIREDQKSPHMWRGEYWDAIMELFEEGAKAGSDFLSIESIGGKDIHDEAIMYCDIKKALFGLGVLGAKDMTKLWTKIVSIADKTNTIAAGDTACGFANTAMVLADKGYVPKVFSAIIRVMSAVRSLIAFEAGAQGPDKDCGYEGVYIKAITGCPISMEGKTSAVAHLSPVGNIAAALADVWSNESVQNIKLLGGMAPTVSMEQLIYDCRLMNLAAERGHSQLMRDLLADSDSKYDPQAYVLRPDIVLNISKEIVKEEGHFLRTKRAALATIKELKEGLAAGKVIIENREVPWLDRVEQQLNAIGDDENAFIKEMIQECAIITKFDPKKYDL